MSRLDIKDLYKLRAEYDRLSQLTWTIRDAQQRFPLTTEENEDNLQKIYLALFHDLEDVYKNIKEIKKRYGKIQ